MPTVAELIAGLPVRLVRGSDSTPIADLTEDSRAVGPGSLFIARRGERADGMRFIPQALDAGCAAVLTEGEPPASGVVDVLIVAQPGTTVAALAARMAERFYGDPSSRLPLVGVTGTNGKTTTAHLVQQLLHAGGMPCGLLGTVMTDTGRRRSPSSLTTPSAIDISRLLREMVDAGCAAAVMEVSSHALEQGRTAALHFAGAVFTNLSGDHLDYHGDEDAYRRAKAKLFEQLPANAWAVLNADDPTAIAMAAASAAPVFWTSAKGEPVDGRCIDVRSAMRGTDATFEGPWGRLDASAPLIGAHNLANALQAAMVAHHLGVDADALRHGLGDCAAPPGRLERVTRADDPYTVLVDYAHTDDALHNVLAALRPLVPERGRLRVVFGCGGDRDRTKRPRMARAAWRFADEVIITSDNPRSEDPGSIIEDAYEGVPRACCGATQRITDRREAIEFAVEHCEDGDVLLIAGKGHEDYQIVGAERRHFDDREVARSAIDRWSARSHA